MKRGALVFLGLGLVFTLAVTSQLICLSGFVRYGLLVHECPSGTPRPAAELNAWSLRRGNPGTVVLSAVAFYTTGPADLAESATIRRSDPKLELLHGDRVVPLVPKEGWEEDQAGVHRGEIVLPSDLPDGDHKLHAVLDTPLGRVETTVPLPVFAPAKIHLLTDRPLYEPGNVMQFRAVALRARDLVPLDGRPGRFIVESPSGEVMLEERASAGPYGVVAGSFPLDAEAETGQWVVRWSSGADTAEVRVTVEPFTLPRFRVELEPSRPFYRRGDRPRLGGKVVYSSGAPVAQAVVEASWRVYGAWPAPTEWMNGGLPTRFVTGPDGRFTVDLPAIPRDLVGRATLHADLSAMDESGDRVPASGDILLTEDAIRVEAMTELGGGLVEGYNNRVYLRATSAHDVVLPNTDLLVKRAWEPEDKGTLVTTDEDGVASLQLDPGPPINVIIPGGPRRPPPRSPPIQRNAAADLIFGDEPRLVDLTALDAWNKSLTGCASLSAEPEREAMLILRVAGDGRVLAASADQDSVGECMKRIALAARLPAGPERLLSLSYSVSNPGPRLVVESSESFPEAFEPLGEFLADAVGAASPCLPGSLTEDEVPYTYVWQRAADSTAITGQLVRQPEAESTWSASMVACVQSRLATITIPKSLLPEAAEDEEGPGPKARFGVVRLAAEHPDDEEFSLQNPDTVVVGYELRVEAKNKDELIGDTRVILNPGQIPPLRIRATPTIAKPGDQIEVAYLRGPGFSGELPEEPVMNGDRWRIESKLDKKTRTTRFSLPADAAGWFITEAYGARALVFVKSEAELGLTLRPERPEYRPGEMAKLLIGTTQAEKPHRAAVGLFGVDESLSQLTALPGPAEFEKLREVAPNEGPAFGVLEVAALQMGRVRGANALEAMVLRVNGLPSRADNDAYTSAQSERSFDPVVALTDHFYQVLEELYREVRNWEETAPKDEQLQPPRLAALWKQAIAKAKAKGASVTDAYGRELRLADLPADLLALTEPRVVIRDGTRLPEDVEDWAQWVHKERP